MEDSPSGDCPPPPLRSPVAPSTASGILPTPSSTPLSTTLPPSSTSTPPTRTLPSSTSPISPSLWTDLFTRASTIPKNFPPPKVSDEGIPIVKAPPSVLLKSSEMWKDFIICYFFGEPPTLKMIFADLNPIWGKKGAIQIKPYTSRSCLIFIPNVPMREWVLDIGFWSAGTVAFSTTLWTSSASLSHQFLSSAPVWLTLHNVPPQLWSIEGFEIIASGVGDPLPSKKSILPPAFGHGSPRVRAVVPLEQGPLPRLVIVEDDDGNQVPVEIQYSNLPPLCPTCNKYGHRAHRCLLRPRAIPPPSKSVASQPNVRTSLQDAAQQSVQSPRLNTGTSLDSLGFISSGPNLLNKGPTTGISLAHNSAPSKTSSIPLGPPLTEAQSSQPTDCDPPKICEDSAAPSITTSHESSPASSSDQPSSTNPSSHHSSTPPSITPPTSSQSLPHDQEISSTSTPPPSPTTNATVTETTIEDTIPLPTTNITPTSHTKSDSSPLSSTIVKTSQIVAALSQKQVPKLEEVEDTIHTNSNPRDSFRSFYEEVIHSIPKSDIQINSFPKDEPKKMKNSNNFKNKKFTFTFDDDGEDIAKILNSKEWQNRGKNGTSEKT